MGEGLKFTFGDISVPEGKSGLVLQRLQERTPEVTGLFMTEAGLEVHTSIPSKAPYQTAIRNSGRAQMVRFRPNEAKKAALKTQLSSILGSLDAA